MILVFFPLLSIKLILWKNECVGLLIAEIYALLKKNNAIVDTIKKCKRYPRIKIKPFRVLV